VSGRLVEAEADALVVAARGEPAESLSFRARVVGLTTGLADPGDGGLDVGYCEVDLDPVLGVALVDPTAGSWLSLR
jgi:hypothetical protein